MQTFLTARSPSWHYRSAETLSDKHLRKQILEAWQIYRAAQNLTKGWRNHPCVRMWKKHPRNLLAYGMACCMEYENRTGKRHAYHWRFFNSRRMRAADQTPPPFLTPRLVGMYRSLVVRKDPDHYKPLFPKADPKTPFVWPNGKVSRS